MKNELLKLKKAELVEIAKKHKILKAQDYRKDELVALILKKQSAAKPKKTAPKSTKSRVVAKKSTAKATVKKSAATQKTRKISAKKKDDLTILHQKAQNIGTISVQKNESQPIQFTTGELPQSYNETKLVAMVRDPYWAFIYWDLSSESYAYAENIYHENDGVRPVIRVYDISKVNFDGTNAHKHWDIDISLDAKSWYVNLGSPGTSFIMDLGLSDRHGKFFLIARSNSIELPIDYPSNVVDEKWMISDIDFEELYALSGGINAGVSSGELTKRKGKKISMVDLLSSGTLASPGAVPKEAERSFFLEVATELILYGRTHADAKLTVANKGVKLRSDGTFTLRYFLPDGKLPLPVKAVSADGVDSRNVNITVNKETK